MRIHLDGSGSMCLWDYCYCQLHLFSSLCSIFLEFMKIHQNKEKILRLWRQAGKRKKRRQWKNMGEIKGGLESGKKEKMKTEKLMRVLWHTRHLQNADWMNFEVKYRAIELLFWWKPSQLFSNNLEIWSYFYDEVRQHV